MNSAPPTTGTVDVKFLCGKQRQRVSIELLVQSVVHFLEHYCGYPWVDDEFVAVARGETGQQRLDSLLERTGFPGDPEGFVCGLVDQLQLTSHATARSVELGGVVVPYQLLVALFEVLMPGGGTRNIKRVSQLEELTNVKVPEEEREDLERVLEQYPVRLSLHVARQMRLSPNVAYQYLPFVDELDAEGDVHTWVGQFYRGIMEQMYRNRVIFIMNMACPVYCRFCFRKHKECRNQRSPNKSHVKQAVLYVLNAPEIKEIVLTGGDPFMNRATLQYAVQELGKVPHLQTLRLASRAVSYYPELFWGNDAYWVNYLVRSNLELHQKGKRIELATHFVHPDELSPDALELISHLVKHGVPVYVQTPFVNGCNESGREMVSLFGALRAAGAEIHYIFMPTSPIRGNRRYWTGIDTGLRAARYLRAHLSDRAMPHVTTATSIGKIDWNTSGWAVKRDENDAAKIWIRTPYTQEYYEPFTPILQISDRVRPNAEGTLDAAFRADIGDPTLFAGPRGLTSSPEAFDYKLAKTERTVAASLQDLQVLALEDQRRLSTCIGAPPCDALVRDHRVRVELDCGADDSQIDLACSYIRQRPAISDVVLSHRRDVLSGLSRTLSIVERLASLRNVRVIRLRSLQLNYNPAVLSRAAVNRLASHNRLQVTDSTRLEIETQFLHSSELRPEHARLVGALRLNGITVYNSTPLLGYINDNEEEMLRICAGCRELGIELCNVYITGLPVQQQWNAEYPIELNSVIDIATQVRRHGSGREVPRYLVRTQLGEVDFSIVPRVFIPHDDQGHDVWVRLLDLDLDYFRAIDPDFSWPEQVILDEEEIPTLPAPGVSLENQEFLFAPVGNST